MRLLPILALASLAVSCTHDAPPPKLSSGGRLVRVAKNDPPTAAKEIGPISAQDGIGCDEIGTEDGTYSRALIKLRNRAAARGGNYVQIMTLMEPHQDSLHCYDHRFVIRGMLYDVPDAQSESASEPTSPAQCDPPCSPGFKCDEGACEPVCNPECSPDQVCRSDRTCGPPS